LIADCVGESCLQCIRPNVLARARLLPFRKPNKNHTVDAVSLFTGSRLRSTMTGVLPLVSPSCHGRAWRKGSHDPGLAPARLHSLVSVNPNLMIAQDAFRTRLALLQRVVPFDVAGVRQLLTSAIR